MLFRFDTLPLLFWGQYDLFHILVSWAYNITDYHPVAEKLDYLAINTKMAATGLLGLYVLDQSAYMWLIAASMLYTYATALKPHVSIDDDKTQYAAVYLLNYLTSTIPLTLITERYDIELLYFTGGAIWAFNMAGRWSIGFMHVCVTMADMMYLEHLL
jgi:hypothetical protein